MTLGFEPAAENPNKVAKTLGAVRFAVSTGGASLVAQKFYDDNKMQAEKTLCLFDAWHFVTICLEELVWE